MPAVRHQFVQLLPQTSKPFESDSTRPHSSALTMSGNDFEFSANSFAQMRADARGKHASPSSATGKRPPAARDGGGDQHSEFAPSPSASDSDDSEDLSAISNRLKGKRPRKNVKSNGFVAAKRGGKVDRVLASEGLFSSIEARLAHTTSSRTHFEPAFMA